MSHGKYSYMKGEEMIKVYLLLIGIATICYFLGIFVGFLVFRPKCNECKEVFIDVSYEDIQHVGYTKEQCGYDK